MKRYVVLLTVLFACTLAEAKADEFDAIEANFYEDEEPSARREFRLPITESLGLKLEDFTPGNQRPHGIPRNAWHGFLIAQ